MRRVHLHPVSKPAVGFSTSIQNADLPPFLYEQLQKLVRSDVCVSSNVLSFFGYTAFDTDDKGLKALALVIKVSAFFGLYADIAGECVTWVYSDTLGFVQIHQVSV